MKSEFPYKENLFFKLNNFQKSYELILKKYNKPAYLYSLKVIKYNFNLLKNSFPSNVRFYYAQKSNPKREFLKTLSKLKAGCDTASIGEIENALRCNFSPADIMFSGPGKNIVELKKSISKKIEIINVESFQELNIINEICKTKKRIQKIIIRINPEFDLNEKNKIIGGKGVSKFGVDIYELPNLIKLIHKSDNIKLIGFHIFNSSQILNENKIISNCKKVVELVKSICEKYNLKISVIDLGGGFGIPYDSNEKILDIKKISIGLRKIINNPKFNLFLKNIKLVFEPGRFISGMAGIYVTKVLYSKISYGKNILITDGGINHLLRPALINQKHPIINLTAIYEKRKKIMKYKIAGPLCTAIDEFEDNCSIRESKPGDYLAILNAGAYGYSESMLKFLSHPLPDEFMI